MRHCVRARCDPPGRGPRAAAWAVAVLAAASVAPASGDELCPCIDPWANATMEALPFYNATADCLTSRDGHCFPLTYGARGCAAYDRDVHPRCVNAHGHARLNAPAWCGHQFCYVNPDACWRPHGPSDLFPGVHYSYEACGYLNDYSSDRVLAPLLRRTTLRISYPPDYGSGHIIRTAPDGRRVGAIPQFVDRVFADLDLDPVVVPISNASLERFPLSSYTACVHDVALNSTDLCVGDFWSTTSRRLMTTFTTELYQDMVYLVTFDEGEPLTHIVSKPFRPFTSGAWILIVGTVVGVGLLITLLEAPFDRKEFGTKSAPAGVAHGLYMAALGFVSGGPVHRSQTTTSRVIAVAFGWFTVVILASYTANLVSFLVTHAAGASVASLGEAMEKGYKVCGLQALHEQMVAKYPKLEQLYVDAEDEFAILSGMDEGACEVAVMDRNMFRATMAGELHEDPRRHCNKLMVGDVLTVMGVAMPVRRELEQEVSWAVTRATARGWYFEEDARADAAFNPPPVCSNPDPAAGDSEALSVHDVLGALVSTGIVAALALVVMVVGERSAVVQVVAYWRGCRRGKSAVAAAVQPGGEGEGKVAEKSRDKRKRRKKQRSERFSLEQDDKV